MKLTAWNRARREHHGWVPSLTEPGRMECARPDPDVEPRRMPNCEGDGCDAKLIDSNPGETLTSGPGQRVVHCPVCGFKGTRYE